RYLAEEGPEGVERVENVEELIAGAAEWAETAGEDGDEVGDEAEEGGRGTGGTGATLIERYLTQAALVTSADQGTGDPTGVTLMTVHMAKGLEWPVVALAGLEDGLFPLARAAGGTGAAARGWGRGRIAGRAALRRGRAGASPQIRQRGGAGGLGLGPRPEGERAVRRCGDRHETAARRVCRARARVGERMS